MERVLFEICSEELKGNFLDLFLFEEHLPFYYYFKNIAAAEKYVCEAKFVNMEGDTYCLVKKSITKQTGFFSFLCRRKYRLHFKLQSLDKNISLSEFKDIFIARYKFSTQSTCSEKVMNELLADLEAGILEKNSIAKILNG